MNYIKQAKLFWRKAKRHSLGSGEIAMYFYLLESANIDRWEGSITESNAIVMEMIGVKSYNTFRAIRDRLVEAGMIQFKSNSGSSKTVYVLYDAMRESFSKNEQVGDSTSSNFDEVYVEVEVENSKSSTSTSSGTSSKNEQVGDSGLLYIKQNKTKRSAEGKPPLAKKNIEPAESKLYAACMKIYADWFELRYKMGPKIDALQGKALKEIIKYFRGQVRKRAEADGLALDEAAEDTRIQDSLRLVLDGWNKLEPFYQKQTKLNQLASNMQNIIIQIKSQHTHGKQANKNGSGNIPLWRRPIENTG